MAKPSQKNALKRNWLLIFFEFYAPLSPQVWHLWQQKINITVGMRVRTRARERTFSLWTLCIEKNACFAMRVCHFTYIAKKKVQISAIFSLFWAISTHIHIGTPRKTILTFHFFFHGESHSNIPNVNPNHCRFLLSSWFLVAVSYKLDLHPFQNIR